MIDLHSAVLPDPDSPTIAMVSPAYESPELSLRATRVLPVLAGQIVAYRSLVQVLYVYCT